MKVPIILQKCVVFFCLSKLYTDTPFYQVLPMILRINKCRILHFEPLPLLCGCWTLSRAGWGKRGTDRWQVWRNMRWKWVLRSTQWSLWRCSRTKGAEMHKFQDFHWTMLNSRVSYFGLCGVSALEQYENLQQMTMTESFGNFNLGCTCTFGYGRSFQLHGLSVLWVAARAAKTVTARRSYVALTLLCSLRHTNEAMARMQITILQWKSHFRRGTCVVWQLRICKILYIDVNNYVAIPYTNWSL